MAHLTDPAFQVETKEKAKSFFEETVAAHAYLDHTISSIKFHKTFFTSCDDRVEINEDGTVEGTPGLTPVNISKIVA